MNQVRLLPLIVRAVCSRFRRVRRIVRDSQAQPVKNRLLKVSASTVQEFVESAAPALLIAKVYSLPLALALAPADTERFLQAIGSLGRAILRLADTITVPSFRIFHKLAAYDISATAEVAPVNFGKVVARSISEVQPRLLVYSSPEWRQDLPLIVSAFEQIQQKYPRAELTLAGSDRSLASLMVNPILRGCLHLHQPCDIDEFVKLCGSHDILLATASGDIAPDQLILGLASGLPAIFPPIGDIRPANEIALLRSVSERRFVRRRIVETVLDLIERPELAASMSAYSRQICSPSQDGPSPIRPPWRLTG